MSEGTEVLEQYRLEVPFCEFCWAPLLDYEGSVHHICQGYTREHDARNLLRCCEYPCHHAHHCGGAVIWQGTRYPHLTRGHDLWTKRHSEAGLDLEYLVSIRATLSGVQEVLLPAEFLALRHSHRPFGGRPKRRRPSCNPGH